MKYMLLIHSNEKAWLSMTPEQAKGSMGAYTDYNAALRAAGILVAGDQLQPTHTAVTLRSTKGKLETFDGPFAETKEQFGGYYIIEVANLESAKSWAAKCPGAHHGSVEIRPLMNLAV